MSGMTRKETLGPYTYHWDQDCFPLGADSLALGGFCTLRPGFRVLDLGCGAGLLLLLCARREPKLTLAGVDLDPHAAQLARKNLRENGLSGAILTGDWNALPLPEADLIISNPPWYPQGSGAQGGPGRTESCPLSSLCLRAASSLPHGGRLALVQRPERLTQLLRACTAAGLEPKRLQLCRHRPDKAPYALLLEAVKGGRPGLDILPDRLSA